MSKSRFVLDRFAKILEQGLTNYKDISDELLTLCKSKRDEIITKMKLVGKEEVEVLNRRISKLEKQLEDLKKKNKKKIKRVK
tara:strand:+ start:438 stop:683 length:246 start_codon:yes stop_codon:yes gene_type:complete